MVHLSDNLDWAAHRTARLTALTTTQDHQSHCVPFYVNEKKGFGDFNSASVYGASYPLRTMLSVQYDPHPKELVSICLESVIGTGIKPSVGFITADFNLANTS